MSRFGAALIVAVLAFAPASPLVGLTVGRSTIEHGPTVRSAGIDPICSTAVCYLVTALISGNGSGLWQSTDVNYVPDGKINCRIVNGVADLPESCADLFPLSYGSVPFYYTVTPDAGSRACAAGECVTFPAHLNRYLVITGDTKLVAGFNLQSYTLIVETGGPGSGSVVGTTPVINCGDICSASVVYGTSILLSPVPDPGSTFSGWEGACAGQSGDCLIGVIADTNTTAFFGSASASTAPTASPAAPRKTPGPTAVAQPTDASASPGTGLESPVVPSPGPDATATAASPAPSAGEPGAPVASATDLTPILLAIVFGGVVIAAGIGVAWFALRRGGAPPS